MNNYYNFFYPACPEPKTQGYPKIPVDLKFIGQGIDGKGDDVNGNPTAGTY